MYINAHSCRAIRSRSRCLLPLGSCGNVLRQAMDVSGTQCSQNVRTFKDGGGEEIPGVTSHHNAPARF